MIRKKQRNKAGINTFPVLMIIVLVAAMIFCSCGIEKSEDHSGVKSSENYSFDLDNDSFIGEQNDQEMGDYQICFYGDIETFTGLTIGKGAGDDVWKEWLQITDDVIKICDVQNNSVTAEYPHELAFKDYVSIVINAGLDGTAEIEVLTNGGAFVQKNAGWVGRNGRLFVQAEGGATCLKNCSLAYHCNGWDKDIWMYGDSYFSTTEKDRWTTYLFQNGASDILLSGRSGEGSEESLTALRTQLQYGTPKTVVWCVGMNDGDSEDGVNKEYKKCLDEVQKICKEKDVELILATVPTCPVWRNDHKNEYIKGLGYQVIDFAAAVGSYESDKWREGMLEEGNERIHPTTEGALAMYAKAVAEVPDLLK